MKKENWGTSLITIKVVRTSSSLRPGLRPREVLVHIDQGKIEFGLNCPIEVTLGLDQDGSSFWKEKDLCR